MVSHITSTEHLLECCPYHLNVKMPPETKDTGTHCCFFKYGPSTELDDIALAMGNELNKMPTFCITEYS